MRFFSRLIGVFFNPRDTFEALSKKPVWVDVLIFLLILATVYAALISPYVAQDRLKLIENDVNLKEKIGEEAYNQRLEFWRNPPQFMITLGILMQLITLPIGFMIQSLIILGLGRLTSVEGKYIQVFSAFIHANCINLILGNAVRLFLIITRKSLLQTTTSMALLFPKLEVMSPPYVFLTQIDFFQLWLFGIFGYALSAIFKIEIKKGLFLSYGFWFVRSLFYVALGLLNLRLAG
jgi:hypothetical protein